MTAKIALICRGTTIGPSTVDGQYLQFYSVEANLGRGDAGFTDQPDRARTFDSVEEARAFIGQVPLCRPFRDDGSPNRPLRDFKFEVVEIEEIPADYLDWRGSGEDTLKNRFKPGDRIRGRMNHNKDLVYEIVDVRPTGYGWKYPDLHVTPTAATVNYFWSENSSDPFFALGWELVPALNVP